MRIPPIVKGLLQSSAPTLLTALALPPPVNAIASTLVGNALKKLPSGPKGKTDRDGNTVFTPEEVVQTVKKNSGNPEIFAALQQAEIDLERYEIETGVRFLELEVKDRERASDLQTRSGISADAFRHGMYIVYAALIGMVLLSVILALVAFDVIQVQPNALTTAAFGVIGTIIGFVNGIAGAIVTFYWGSSQGSKEKSDAIGAQIQNFGKELEIVSGEVEKRAREDEQKSGSGARGGAGDPLDENAALPAVEPTIPASPQLVEEVWPELIKPHRHFPEFAEWRLTADGVSVDGAPASRSAGKLVTIPRIWDEFGELCQKWAEEFGVPVELIVATIATESSGKPNARRQEPQLNTESVGLMQTLVTTAAEALGRRQLKGDDLLDPGLSIQAGTAFIARQRRSTHFDPPLVAAAYNAGSLRREKKPGSNRWGLVCFPLGTGEHIDRFLMWFGDCMIVSRDQNWGMDGAVPSFATAFKGGGDAGGRSGDLPPSGGTDGGGAPSGQPGSGGAAASGANVSAAGVSFESTPNLAAVTSAIPLDTIEESIPLAKEMQYQLTSFGYLDPPPDGEVGAITRWALKTFCERNALAFEESLSPEIAKALTDRRNAMEPMPADPARPWLGRVISFMREHLYWLCLVPECRNIVYLEGVSEDGTPNNDQANVFNDLRIVFWRDISNSLTVKTWQATTEPGKIFTDAPLNPLGAARIKFGQYAAWRVDTHKKGKKGAHEALCQVSDVTVHRDLNKDHSRKGDKTETGVFGINQHWGFDLPEDNIGKSSAGCLVGRTTSGHKEFMEIVKKDPRFQERKSYRFRSTILDGSAVFA